MNKKYPDEFKQEAVRQVIEKVIQCLMLLSD